MKTGKQGLVTYDGDRGWKDMGTPSSDGFCTTSRVVGLAGYWIWGYFGSYAFYCAIMDAVARLAAGASSSSFFSIS